MKTKLGWDLSGPSPQSDSLRTDVNVISCYTLRLDTSSSTSVVGGVEGEDPLVEQVKKFWELENIGVSPYEGSVHDKFLDTIRFRDGRYEVSLPWKTHHALLPDNYEVAVSRLYAVFR